MESENANKLILRLDNHNEILSFKFRNGFGVWPQIRYTIYKELLNDQIYEIDKKATSYLKKLFSLYDSMKYHFVVFSKNLLKVKGQYDCLIFNSSVSCFKNNNGSWLSKINFFFSSIDHLKILNIFQSNRGKYLINYSEPYAYHEAIYLKSILQAKLIKKTPLDDYRTIADFITFLKVEVGENLSSQFYDQLKNELFNFVKIHYYLVDNFNKLLSKANPKFIVVEDGNYGGGDKTTLIWCANKLGIKTIEVQHGVFDLAFKYGDNLVGNKDFSLFKTSLLFTMGKYWTNYSNISSKVYELGYPYLEEIIGNYTFKTDNSILFISQGLVTFPLKEIAIELAQKSNYKIIYRLHPNEHVSDYADFKKLNIEVSNIEDLFELITKCKGVVGSYSTVLFEALLFGKKIFVHRNKFSDEYIPENLGIRFGSAADLINSLETDSVFLSEKNNFWSLNWKENLDRINQKEVLW